ncbi:MAG: Hpt domain-containing protein [Lautropia sp.]
MEGLPSDITQDLDLVALSWCVPEIRESLARARAELDQHLAAEAGSTRHLKNARIHLHQAHGAMQVADIVGVPVVTQEAEALLGRGEHGELAIDAAVVAMLHRTFAAVAEYLEDLQAGARLPAVVLFSYYQPLLQLRQAERIDPADLYFPDLSIQPPATLAMAGPGAAGDDIGVRAAAARREFERGLLGFLRGNDNPGSIATMHAALTRMLEANPRPNARAFLWLSLAVVDALQHRALPIDLYTKRLIARVNIQARRTLENGDPVADRLLKDLLFLLARAGAGSALATEAQHHYRLAGTVPADFERARFGLTDPARVAAARNAVQRLKKAWEKIVRGAHKERDELSAAATALIDAMQGLPYDGMSNLSVAIGDLAAALPPQGAVPEALSLEVATAILFADEALDGGLRADPGYDARANELGQRLRDAATRPAAYDEAAPQWLIDLSRKASERITTGAFVAELQNNLRAIEQALDANFRDASAVAQLAAIKPQLTQSTGVFRALGYVDAARACVAIDEDVDRIQSGRALDGADQQRLATNLSALGFFVESLLQPVGQAGSFAFDETQRLFVAKLGERRFRESHAAEPAGAAAGEHAAAAGQPPADAGGSAEARIAAERQAIVPWLATLAAAPQSPDAHENLLRCLVALERDAVLVDDLDLKRSASEGAALLQSLPSHVDADAVVDDLLALLAQLAGVAVPSRAAVAAPAEPPAAAPAAADVDAELLEIFVLEADEVLQAIAESLAASREAPSDLAPLTTIRRGFHTLKGSSRMVGLEAFGEAGWAFEQLMNKWLADEQPGNAKLYRLIEAGHALFADWAAKLAQDPGAVIDASALIARCEAMRDGRELLDIVLFDDAPAAPAAGTVPAAAAAAAVESSAPIGEAETPAPEGSPAVEATPATATPSEMPSLAMLEALAEPADEIDAPTGEPATDGFGPSATDGVEVSAAGGVDVSVNEAVAPLAEIDGAAPPVDQAALADWIAAAERDAAAAEAAAAEQAEAESEARAEAQAAAAAKAQAEAEAAAAEQARAEAEAAAAARAQAEAAAAAQAQAEAAAAAEARARAEAAAAEQVRAEAEAAAAAKARAEAEAAAAAKARAEAAAQAQAEAAAATSVRVGDRSIDAGLYEVFNAEATQLRRQLDVELANWREQGGDAAPAGLVRALHSLVGTSRHVGLLQLRAIAEPAEQLLLTQANAGRPLPAEHLAQLYAAIAAIQSMLDQFAQQIEPHRDEVAERQMRELAHRWSQPESIARADDDGDRAVRGEALRKKAAEVLGAARLEAERAEDPYRGLVDELDGDLAPVFFAETDELLPAVDAGLRAWRGQPADATAAASLMRLLHTIKGSARMAGAMRLGQMVHDIETRVEEATGLPEVPEALIDQLLAQCDAAVARYELLKDPVALAESIAAERAQAAAEADGSAGTSGPARVAAVPSRAGRKPRRGRATAGTVDDGDGIDDDGTSPARAEPAAAATGSQPTERDAEPIAGVAQAAAAAQQVIRVRADLLDRMVAESGEVAVARARLDNEVGVIRLALAELTENVNRLRAQLREIEIQADNQIQAQIASARDTRAEFDPLEFDRYTRFQELTRMLAESVNDVATVQQNALRAVESATQDLKRQGQVSRSLQQNLMRVRMVQFATVADRLYRVVRQAGKDADKRVMLEIKGGNAEIDRSVLERMAGPIEHLLRNAVAHGIEPRDRRVAAGKRETGELTITVRQEGNEVILGFSDDGAGLDFRRIEQRARERGLLPDGRSLSEPELAQLIFAPGFSTATSVTALAGRGVGMDVVRAEVAAMGGRIDITSKAGAGTTFRIHLPVSLAVSQVVLLGVDTGHFAVQAALVEQILQMKPESLAAAYEAHAIEHDGESVPLYYLGSLLELPNARPIAQRQSPVVVVRTGSSRIALHVDRVVPNQEVVIKNVGPQLARLTGVAGATILGNGDIVLILNPVQLALARATSQAGEGDTASFTATEIPTTATVMVVDDSVTVRKVTQRLLVREGYTVLLAKDGVDALRQLQDIVPDMMLVDVEMPRMDGFDLTKNIRGSERTQDIPIIMITSRTADKHRNHAFSLGVDVFLGKPYAEDELLRHVRGFARQRRTVTS